MRRIIVTKLDGSLITAEEENGRITGLFLEPAGTKSLVGRIYVGQVRRIVKNIRAAFVEMGQGMMCFYPLEEWERYPLPGAKQRVLKEGDGLVFQIGKDAVKTKAPVGTTSLTFTGQYLVLMTGKTGIFFSSKIKDEARKQELREILSERAEGRFPFGLIVRTNGATAPREALLSEFEELFLEASRVFSLWETRTAGTLLYEPEPAFLSEIFNNRTESLLEVVTDDRKIYELVEKKETALQKENETLRLPDLRLYEDSYPLSKLYSLETALSRALSEKVWLKSGGSLVIEPTEALVSIDVNTGKFEGKKNLEETFLKINLEAAAEIAVQLRLRNLSGIILVDFIDMEEEDHKEQLLKAFGSALQKDSVKVNLLGFTRLNLVELTRKKVRKPLHELVTGENGTKRTKKQGNNTDIFKNPLAFLREKC
ncbi:MAG: ribonuclease E/G [Lachnospiraceae bacterium]|nr:ribonuclease E/G [Lachnospiraceae bacterium]